MSESLLDLIGSWRISLIALNRSKDTVTSYINSMMLYHDWCESHAADPFHRKSVQGFVAGCLEAGYEATTARLRHYSLKSFFKWLLEEGEIQQDPFVGLRPPRMDEKVVPSMSDHQIDLLLSTCKGSDFLDRRDGAILRFMFETGVRSNELCNMDLADVNMTTMTAVVVKGKGGKGRTVPFSPSTATSLDRYMRARKKVAKPETTKLWVGVTTGRGIGYQAMYGTLKRRARKVGLDDFHPHRTRHTAATRWLRQGGSEGGLMAIAGWTSRSMIDRYAGASAGERAIEESKNLNLGL